MVAKLTAEQIKAIEAAKAQGAAEARARVLEVLALCQIVGKPALAAGFMRRRLSVKQVRHELQHFRAVESEASAVRGYIMPDAGGTENHQAGWDAAFAAARNEPTPGQRTIR